MAPRTRRPARRRVVCLVTVAATWSALAACGGDVEPGTAPAPAPESEAPVTESTEPPPPAEEPRIEWFEDRVFRVEEAQGGASIVAFALSARWYVIDRERSPDAAAMAAFADAALASGETVYVTADATGTPTNETAPGDRTRPSGLPVLLRLSAEPAPDRPSETDGDALVPPPPRTPR